MNYRLLALDLDGTLTNSQKIITPKTRETLLQAQQQGLRIVLASGRPTEGILHLARELQMQEYGGFVLAFNGARVLDLAAGEILWQQTLPPGRIPLIAGLARQYGVGVLTYLDGAVLTETPEDPYIGIECRVNGIPCRRAEDFAAAVTGPVPKCLMTGDGDHMAVIEPLIREALPDLSVYRSEPYFLEIMPKGVDKARTLEQLLRHLGLTRQQLAACGDGFNDVSMVAFAGLGVAMANANPAVLEVADAVTLSNDEDGVAEAVRRYML